MYSDCSLYLFIFLTRAVNGSQFTIYNKKEQEVQNKIKSKHQLLILQLRWQSHNNVGDKFINSQQAVTTFINVNRIQKKSLQ